MIKTYYVWTQYVYTIFWKLSIRTMTQRKEQPVDINWLTEHPRQSGIFSQTCPAELDESSRSLWSNHMKSAVFPGNSKFAALLTARPKNEKRANAVHAMRSLILDSLPKGAVNRNQIAGWAD